MAPKKKQPPQKPSAGTSAGLLWFMIFLVSFFAVGYSIFFSIFLALVGGFTIRVIVDWWTAKDEPLPQTPPVATIANQDAIPPFTPRPAPGALGRPATSFQLSRKGKAGRSARLE